MKFALFYEIPVARPWTPEQGAPGVQEHDRAGRARRQDGLPRVLDGRAPLPRGVLALLEPRGALRRGRRAHREHPHRLRRAPAAEAVQPPDPHRGVGRGARPHLRRPRRLRHRPLVDARRARGLRHRPRRDARDVARGARAHRRARGPRTSTRPTASTGRWARRAACTRSRCKQPHPPIFGATSQPRRPQGDGQAGHRAVLVHRRAPARAARRATSRIYRKGLAECEKPAGKFLNDTAATFTMVHCAPTTEEATEVAEGVVRVVPELRRRAHRVGGGVAWRSATAPTSAPTSTRRDMLAAGSATACSSHLTIDYLRDSGSAVMGDPDQCIASAKRYEAVGCDLLLCLVNPLQDPAREGHAVDRAHGQARPPRVQVAPHIQPASTNVLVERGLLTQVRC